MEWKIVRSKLEERRMRFQIFVLVSILFSVSILSLSCTEKEQRNISAPTAAKPVATPEEVKPEQAGAEEKQPQEHNGAQEGEVDNQTSAFLIKREFAHQECNEKLKRGMSQTPRIECDKMVEHPIRILEQQTPAPEQPALAAGKTPEQPEQANNTRGILIDPDDTTQNMSYWRDAREGDWVRFLNLAGLIGMRTVISPREGSKVNYEFRLFDRTGKEIDMDRNGHEIPRDPNAKPDITGIDIAVQDADTRNSLKTNPFITRSVVEWKVFKSDKVIRCERRLTQGMERTNDTVYSRDVHAGGEVFARTGSQTIITLLDWGDKDNPPKWNLWTDDELKNWKLRWDRSWDEELVSNEDLQEPEPPETAEDPPSEAIASLMSKVATILAQKVAPLTETAKELASLLPLLKELEELHRKERFGYAAQEAQSLTSAVRQLSDALSSGKADTIKESLARARSAYENLRIATGAEAE